MKTAISFRKMNFLGAVYHAIRHNLKAELNFRNLQIVKSENPQR